VLARTHQQLCTVTIGKQRFQIDLAAAHSLALTQAFDGTQPRWFNTPPAHSTPVALPGFSGAVATGASCNCHTLHLTPHCDGTHTECAGHLTRAELHVMDVAPRALLPALLLSVQPQSSADCGESSEPAPRAGDLLISRRALAAAWPRSEPFAPNALLIRTLPNDAGKLQRNYTREPPAFLSRKATEFIVTRGIEHLVLDVPSADRGDDGGRLCAHRIFFGMPPGSSLLRDVQRPQATLTELAYMDNTMPDGHCLLMLQLPALRGDAVPSRPLLYRLRSR
jgi:kynurenine formamidase